MTKFKKVIVFLVGLCLFLPPLPAIAAVNCANPGPNKDLSGCNFTGANLSGLDLSGSILNRANLTNANLSNTTLTRIRATDLTGIPSSLPSGWITLGGFLLGPTADLSATNLNNLNLSNVNLSGANLEYASLKNVNLNNANLANAELERVYGNGITGTPLQLPTDWVVEEGLLLGPRTNLSSLTISDVDFREFNINGASFRGSTLIRVNLSGMDLGSSDMSISSLISSNVEGTDFSDADFEGLYSSGLIGEPAALPESWVLRGGYLFGYYANFSGRDLSNFDFTGLDLTAVNFDLANLSNANLAGLDLSRTTMTRADLNGANITGTDFTDVNLNQVSGRNLIGTPIGLDENWTLFHGFLVGPTANLNSANFSGLDLRSLKLTGVDLVYANLRNTNLAGMDLDEANLRGIDLTGANISGTSFAMANLSNVYASGLIGVPDQLPNNWKLRNGYLLGPTTNLNNANLTGVDLKGLDLSGASMLYTNLTNADLRGAILTGANLEGADFTDANLLNVVTGELTGTPIGIPNTFSLTDGTIKGIINLNPTPTVTGLAKVGSTLTAVPGSWDEGVTLSYQWQRNGVAIPNATNSKYVLVPSDYNKGVSVLVTGTATGGATKSQVSLDKPIAIGSMKVVAPKITGTVAKGKTVKATVSAWGVGTKITYSWLLDGKAIKGATKNTYKILPTQVGKKLSVLIKQTGTGYTAASKASLAIKIK